MTSLLFNRTIRSTQVQTWIGAEDCVNLHQPEYEELCRTELLFLCKVLATVHGHSSDACARYFRIYGIECTIYACLTGSIWIFYCTDNECSHLWMRACAGASIKVEGNHTITTSFLDICLTGKIPRNEEDLSHKETSMLANKRMAACFDFDGTLVEVDTMKMGKHPRKFIDEVMVSIWDRKASFQYCTPNLKVWSLLNGYLEIGVPTFLVTGRKTPVERKLLRYIRSKIGDDAPIRLVTLPGVCIRYNNRGIKMLVPDASLAKKFVYSILSQKYKCLVYEDDSKVLSEIKDLGCAGIQVSNGTLEYANAVKTHIIALCGPPGSGKSTILRGVRGKLENIGVKVSYISGDIELREDRDWWSTLKQELQKKPQVLLLDLCLSSVVLDTIKMTGCPYTIYTHMPVENGKVHSYYPNWCFNNVLHRDNHETLYMKDFGEYKEIVIAKMESLESILPQCSLVYPKLYSDIQDYMSILPPQWKMAKIGETCMHTIWPIPDEKPLHGKVWSAFHRKIPHLRNIACYSESNDYAFNVTTVIPKPEHTRDVLVHRIVNILHNTSSGVYPGFYFGLGISESNLPRLELPSGQTRPFVHHLTLDVTDPLGPQKVEPGTVYVVRGKNIYTNPEKSLLALELKDKQLVEYPHVSLCWKGKPVDCRRVLESGTNVVVSEMSSSQAYSSFPGWALYLV